MSAILYNLMSYSLECDYREIYRTFTYDMYALCKKYGCKVRFLDRRYDYDPELDADTDEDRFKSFINYVTLFVAVVEDDSEFPAKQISWALRYNKDKMLVLLHEDDEEKSAPISRKSLKYKLYFEEKMYPQSFWYYGELTFWIAIQIKIRVGLSSELIRVDNGYIYFEDVYIGLASEIPVINRSIEYRTAKERGVNKDRITLDIINAVEFVIRLQSHRCHEKLRPIIETQLRGDNMGLSLLLNHESLCSEVEEAFERYKTTRNRTAREEIEVILDKMQLGIFNSYIINCADENRDDYAASLRKDINKYRNRLNRFKPLD